MPRVSTRTPTGKKWAPNVKNERTKTTNEAKEAKEEEEEEEEADPRRFALLYGGGLGERASACPVKYTTARIWKHATMMNGKEGNTTVTN